MKMKLLEIVLVFTFSGSVLSKLTPFYNPKHHEMVIKEASDVNVDVNIVSKDVGVGVHVDVENNKEYRVRMIGIKVTGLNQNI